MVESVLFDFDGTLVDYIESDTKAFKNLHSYIGSNVSFKTFFGTAVEKITIFHEMVETKKADPLEMHQFRLKTTCVNHGIPWTINICRYIKRF